MLGCVSIAQAFQEESYALEKYLFYLAMETMIHMKWKKEGVLDAWALPWCLQIIKEKCVILPKKGTMGHKNNNT